MRYNSPIHILALSPKDFADLLKIYVIKVVLKSSIAGLPTYTCIGREVDSDRVEIDNSPASVTELRHPNMRVKANPDGKFVAVCKMHSKRELIDKLTSIGVPRSQISKLKKVSSSKLEEMSASGGLDDGDDESVKVTTTKRGTELTFECAPGFFGAAGTECKVSVRREYSCFIYAMEIDIDDHINKLVDLANEAINKSSIQVVEAVLDS